MPLQSFGKMLGAVPTGPCDSDQTPSHVRGSRRHRGVQGSTKPRSYWQSDLENVTG